MCLCVHGLWWLAWLSITCRMWLSIPLDKVMCGNWEVCRWTPLISCCRNDLVCVCVCVRTRTYSLIVSNSCGEYVSVFRVAFLVCTLAFHLITKVGTCFSQKTLGYEYLRGLAAWNFPEGQELNNLLRGAIRSCVPPPVLIALINFYEWKPVYPCMYVCTINEHVYLNKY